MGHGKETTNSLCLHLKQQQATSNRIILDEGQARKEGTSRISKVWP